VGELYDLLEQPLDVPHDGRHVFGDPPQRRGDLQRLRNHYESRGYFHVQILPQTSVPDPAKPEIDIVYRIVEGEPTRVGRVDITGNRITRERVIRRQLTVAPGDLLRTEQLQLTFLRLYQSQYFRDVRIDPRPSLTPGYTDVLIDVEESDKSGNLQFGGAYNQSLGLQGQFQLEIQNFDVAAWSWPWNIFRSPHWRGGGQSLRLGVSAGGKHSNYSINFNEPRLFDSKFSLGLSGSIFSRSYLDWDERRRGGSVEIGRTLAPWVGVGFSWSGQLVQVRNVNLFAPPELLALEQLGVRPLSKWRAHVGFDWVERDAGRRAYQGFELDLSAELAHRAFGSHWDFWGVGVHPEFHWTLFGHASEWRHVISLRLALDYVEPIGDEAVPIFERHYAGGFGTIRGFDYRDVGPRVNNRPVGGNILATGSLEYSIPLYRDTLGGSQHLDIIRMVFFYDWGTVLEDWESYESDTWRMSWGFGFRLNPAGFPVPFALDFGWVLKRAPEDDTELISVTFDVRF
jgi:outer membrane protein insertion porin family